MSDVNEITMGEIADYLETWAYEYRSMGNYRRGDKLHNMSLIVEEAWEELSHCINRYEDEIDDLEMEINSLHDEIYELERALDEQSSN